MFATLLLFAGLLCVGILLLIGFFCNRRFKKSGLPANLMVGFSVGTKFVYGSISVGMFLCRTAWFFAVISIWIDPGACPGIRMRDIS